MNSIDQSNQTPRHNTECEDRSNANDTTDRLGSSVATGDNEMELQDNYRWVGVR